MKNILIISMALLLSACVANPAFIDVQSADYGEKPSSELYEKKVKAYQNDRLKDPMSAVYSFSEPKKGWCKFKGEVHFGWIVDYTLNAKNSYGGYVGAKPEFTFVKNDTAWHMPFYLKDNCDYQ
ncbi:hypothetical protein [Morganella morganii]|uniref:hypothetical protein n=1 Tax=Morganella morganii TaxID=582 RepID=UPI001C494597|nr:hypothetical protein [Morganella morganii]QXO52823.1 hypothetical protein JC830_14015 [Morganella morganii]